MKRKGSRSGRRGVGGRGRGRGRGERDTGKKNWDCSGFDVYLRKLKQGWGDPNNWEPAETENKLRFVPGKAISAATTIAPSQPPLPLIPSL